MVSVDSPMGKTSLEQNGENQLSAQEAAEQEDSLPQLELALREESLAKPERIPQNLEEWETYLQAKYTGPKYRWQEEKWWWNLSNDARAGKGETDPRKAKNPLLASFMGDGATETQLEWLLWHSMRYEGWLAKVAPYMRAGISCAEAVDLCEWLDSCYGGDNLPWNTPCRIQPKSTWWNWISTVRKAAGLPEFTSDEKVKNRVTRIMNWFQEEPIPVAIPLKKGERLYVWLLTILISLGLLTFWFIVGSLALVIVFGAIFTGLGLLYFGFKAVAGFFKSKRLTNSNFT